MGASGRPDFDPPITKWRGAWNSSATFHGTFAKFGRVLDDATLAVVRLYLMGHYQGNDYDPS